MLKSVYQYVSLIDTEDLITVGRTTFFTAKTIKEKGEKHCMQPCAGNYR